LIKEVINMRDILKAFYAKPLIFYLVVALLTISTFTGPAEAMYVPTAPHQNITDTPLMSVGRAADMTKIRIALESKLVRQKLLDYGLSPEEAMVRMNKLSDEQIAQLAAHTESLQAGGDGGELIVGILVLAILVVVLVYLLHHRIEVK
jgi:hypothetical protein